MSLKLVRDELNAAECTAERDAAWHVYLALQRYQRDVPEVQGDPIYQRALSCAYDRYARLFGGEV